MAAAEHELGGLSRALDATRERLEQEDSMLAGPVGVAQERLDDVARGLSHKQPREVVGDIEGFARSNPWLFLGGCFLGGAALARFLKASEDDGYERRPSRIPPRVAPEARPTTPRLTEGEEA